MRNNHEQLSSESQRAPEAAEVTTSAYELLRLRPSRWRSLLADLAGPAIRLHSLRNARTRMWRQAIVDLDRPCR